MAAESAVANAAATAESAAAGISPASGAAESAVAESAVAGRATAESAPAAGGPGGVGMPAGAESAPGAFTELSTAFHCRIPVFDGPLDLLLNLVRENQMDIHAIPIAEITKQYCDYVAILQEIDLELAGDYLEMASTLLRWKARAQLPLPPSPEEPEEEDPQERLARMLLEYQRYKTAAGELRGMLERQSDYIRHPGPPVDRELRRGEVEFEEVSLFDLLKAFKSVMDLVGKKLPKVLEGEGITVGQMKADIIERLRMVEFVRFADLFLVRGSKEEIVVTFLALLELMKIQQIRVHQAAGDGEIYIYRKTADEGADA